MTRGASPSKRTPHDATSVYTGATKFAVEDILPLGRHTLSAKVAHKHYKGMEAIFASFPKQKQLAVREHMRDYFMILGRIKALEDRLAVGEQRGVDDEEPEVLQRLRDQLDESTFQLKKHTGKAFPAVQAALNDEDLLEAFQLAVETEEDTATGEEARLWRRRLDTRMTHRTGGRAWRATHNHATTKGRKSVWNQGGDGTEHLSYYQRSQMKYGKNRRGSTSIAGAWEEIFGEDDEAQKDLDKAAAEEESRVHGRILSKEERSTVAGTTVAGSVSMPRAPIHSSGSFRADSFSAGQGHEAHEKPSHVAAAVAAEAERRYNIPSSPHLSPARTPATSSQPTNHDVATLMASVQSALASVDSREPLETFLEHSRGDSKQQAPPKPQAAHNGSLITAITPSSSSGTGAAPRQPEPAPAPMGHHLADRKSVV